MNTSKWPGYQMCPGVQINSPLGRERNEGYEGICPKQIFLKNWDCERRGGGAQDTHGPLEEVQAPPAEMGATGQLF